MKELYIVNIENGIFPESAIEKLRHWAKGQPNDTYAGEYPRKIERNRTLLQLNAYFARCDWFVKAQGEYSKTGYHTIFMERAGYGEYVPSIRGGFTFAPWSISNNGKVTISMIDRLIEEQDRYNFERNEDLPHKTRLPSIEEWKSGKR